MSKCLITTLDAVVNDNTLPVLELMQQFTLDAITASGNETMSDAQKAALNHFFYQIGAIDNNSLWGKVKVLLLPMLCGQNLAKSLVNYKDNTVEATPDSNWSFTQNGGLTASNSAHITLASKFVGSNASLSVCYVSMAAYMQSTELVMRLGNTSEIKSDYATRRAGSDLKYLLTGRNAAFYKTSSDLTLDVGGMICKTEENYYKLVGSNSGSELTGTDTSLSDVQDVISYDATTGQIQLRASAGELGAEILANEMTQSELNLVLNALGQLKKAFAPTS